LGTQWRQDASVRGFSCPNYFDDVQILERPVPRQIESVVSFKLWSIERLIEGNASLDGEPIPGELSLQGKEIDSKEDVESSSSLAIGIGGWNHHGVERVIGSVDVFPTVSIEPQ